MHCWGAARCWNNGFPTGAAETKQPNSWMQLVGRLARAPSLGQAARDALLNVVLAQFGTVCALVPVEHVMVVRFDHAVNVRGNRLNLKLLEGQLPHREYTV
jgi:hypothetical protein